MPPLKISELDGQKPVNYLNGKDGVTFIPELSSYVILGHARQIRSSKMKLYGDGGTVL